MPTLRKIFFYIFLAIYLTVCPLLILRMLGFVRDPLTHQLVKTGIIYVSTNPSGAHVYINEHKANETTPTVIRDLTSNNYAIRLELTGYQSWQNTIPLVERKATVLENILLIPQEWVVKHVSDLPFENLLSLGDGNSLLLWQNMKIKDLYLLRLHKDSSDDNDTPADISLITSVFPQESIYSDAHIVRFFTVDKSPFFIVRILMAEKDKYLWVDASDKQIHIEDISDLLPQEPIKLWWEASDEKNIYVYLNEGVNRLDIKAKAIYPDLTLKDLPLNKMKHAPIVNPKTSFTVFQDHNQMFLRDIVSFGKPRLEKITNVYPGSSAYYSERNGKLYYLDAKTRRLCTIVILQHKPMLPKNIADTLRLKESEP